MYKNNLNEALPGNPTGPSNTPGVTHITAIHLKYTGHVTQVMTECFTQLNLEIINRRSDTNQELIGVSYRVC